MKKIHILGMLAFLVLAVGSANAADVTITTTNTGIKDVSIDVFYNLDVPNSITFIDNSNTYTNHGISWVAYNLANDASTITGYPQATSPTGTLVYDKTNTNNGPTGNIWDQKNNFGAKGEFGTFDRVYGGKSGDADRFQKVVVILSNTFSGTIPTNALGNVVGVHFVYGTGSTGGSCFVSGNIKEVPIPEFPSVALPVAAILGILIIFGRRKKE